MDNILRSLLVFALLCGYAWADQRDARLTELFVQLKNSSSIENARSTEAEIWTIWGESHSEIVDALMEKGVDAMSKRDFDDALERFDDMVEMAPEFAEGWNKRATVYYLRDDLPESVLDIQKTLALEPRHFGALSGMGLIFMERGDLAGALGAYEEVLKINPNSVSAQFHAKHLRDRLYGESL